MGTTNRPSERPSRPDYKIPKSKVYELQNKFRGSMTTGGNFWGQVAYVKARLTTGTEVEGMLVISGCETSETCRVSFHTEHTVLETTQSMVDKLIEAEILR